MMKYAALASLLANAFVAMILFFLATLRWKYLFRDSLYLREKLAASINVQAR